MLEIHVDGGVATVTLCRAPVNAMSDEWVARFHGLLDSLDARDDWSVLHVRSAQKIFSAGADLKQIAENFSQPMEEQLDVGRRYQKLFHRIQQLPAITLAQIGGRALGGGLELALACDLRIASRSAKMGLPEVTLGLIPGAGGTQRLTWLCGRAIASRLILSGEVISADEAHRIGLVQWCVEPEHIADEAARIAARYAAVPRHAALGAKSAIAAANDPGVDGFNRETEVVRTCFESAQTRALVTSFLAR
jgi:enoyl-CoA hydratase/carnithine racemase